MNKWWLVPVTPFLMASVYLLVAGFIGGIISLAAFDLSILFDSLRVWAKPTSYVAIAVRIVAIFMSLGATYSSLEYEMNNEDK